jgi:BirA family biotin operon repressor/biotin-[acetyl-CoA-carboxylase] ligase
MRNKNTLFIGKVVLAYDELPSTNSYAQTLLAKSAPSEGTVISAQHQTAGRGQIGSKWYSEAGKSICASTILYPRFLPARQQYLLNLSVALALREALATYCPQQVRVKWPNDIYIGNHKLAGILIQNSLQGQNLAHSIIGIGVNVKQMSFPAGLQQAASLEQFAGKALIPDEVLQTILEMLEQRYLQLRAGTLPRQLREDYHNWMLGYGQTLSFECPGQLPFQATVKGIDDAGKLRLQRNGQETSYGLKEIRFVL